jgi:hypothetical protein
MTAIGKLLGKNQYGNLMFTLMYVKIYIMKIIKRITRDREMLEYLATPVKLDTGDYMKNGQDKFVYPTLDDASQIYDISTERISTIKNKNPQDFEDLKVKILEDIHNGLS